MPRPKPEEPLVQFMVTFRREQLERLKAMAASKDVSARKYVRDCVAVMLQVDEQMEVKQLEERAGLVARKEQLSATEGEEQEQVPA